MPKEEVEKQGFQRRLLADAQRRGIVGTQATVDELDNPAVLRRLFDAWEQEAARQRAAEGKAKRDRAQYIADHPGIYADDRSPEDRRDSELRPRSLDDGADYDGELLTNRQLRKRKASEELLQTLGELESSPLSALFVLCSKPENYAQAAHVGAAVWGLVQIGAEIANPSMAYHPPSPEAERPPALDRRSTEQRHHEGGRISLTAEDARKSDHVAAEEHTIAEAFPPSGRGRRYS